MEKRWEQLKEMDPSESRAGNCSKVFDAGTGPDTVFWL